MFESIVYFSWIDAIPYEIEYVPDVPKVGVSKMAQCSGLFLSFSYGRVGWEKWKNSVWTGIAHILSTNRRFLEVDPHPAFL
ncbi:MAG: hypothetical protein WKF36_11900 [Candidatus Nitrosocosmicus sp.]